jgi:hypothetical protein
MKKYTIPTLLLFLLLTATLMAQPPGPGFGKPGGPPPANGRLFGKLLDATTKQPVEYATVAAFRSAPGRKDSVVGGGLVQSNGDFNLTNLPMGPLKIRFSFMGYDQTEKQVLLTPGNTEQDLGNLTLSVSTKMLKEVTVRTEKTGLQLQVDRKVYNVDKNLASLGGSAEDVLKAVPAVSIDADGAATLRNQSATILIDGRLTNLSLNQIPSAEIEQVEIITNPGAKFDANTTGGILNLVMKKNRKPGYNGMVQAGASPTGRWNAMANLNFKQYPFNLSLSYNVNRGVVNNNHGFNNRTDLLNGQPTGYFDQNNLSNVKNLFQFGRVSLEYAIDNRNTITVAGNGMGGNFIPLETQSYSTFDGARTLLNYGTRDVTSANHWQKLTPQMTFKHNFPKKGQELTIDAQVNFEHSTNNSDYTTRDYSAGGTLLADPEIQQNRGGKTETVAVGQIDYVNPLSETSKLELGAKVTDHSNHAWLNVGHYDYTGQTFTPDDVLTTNYQINEMINAAYINYTGALGRWRYVTGLRFEQSYFKGVQLTENKEFSYNYPGKSGDVMKALFPSIYLTRKLENNQEFQVNFSRKINRPNFFQIMPFFMFADKYSYRIGNPALKPEMINLAEINYGKQFGEHNFLTSLYMRQTTDPITNVTNPSPANPQILVGTFENGSNALVFGSDNTLKLNLWKSLEWTNNFNLFQTRITYGNIRNSGWAYNAKTTINLKLPKGFSFQTTAAYESPRIIPQGTMSPMYFADLSVKKDFSKNTSLTLAVVDAFDTRRMGSTIQTDYYNLDSSRRRENRYVKLTLMVRFGKMDATIFKGRRQGGGDDGGGQEF